MAAPEQFRLDVDPIVLGGGARDPQKNLGLVVSLACRINMAKRDVKRFRPDEYQMVVSGFRGKFRIFIGIMFGGQSPQFFCVVTGVGFTANLDDAR